MARAQRQTPSTLCSIELEIEELILRGFPPAERHRIGEAIERELARLLTEQGLTPGLIQDGEIPELDAGAFQAAPGDRPGGVGAQVAQSIYQSLNS